MAEYQTVNLSQEVKDELDKQRTTPMGQVSANEFIKYLLEQNKKKTK